MEQIVKRFLAGNRVESVVFMWTLNDVLLIQHLDKSEEKRNNAKHINKRTRFYDSW